MFGKKKSEQDKAEVPEKVTDENGSLEKVESTAAVAIKMKKKHKKKKRIIIGVVVLIVIVVVVKMSMGGEAPAVPVSTDNVTRMDVQHIIPIKGTVEGNNRAEITSSENREIASIAVKEGDTVKKGQVLATLKAADKDDNGKYQKQQAQNNLDAAKFDYDSSKKLYEEGAISKQEYLRSQTAYENAKTTLAGLYDTATTKNSLTSPINGVVTRVNAKVGLTANQSYANAAPLFVVEDLSSLKMEVKVSEYDISDIKLGQTVVISAEVLGANTVNGKVSHIAPTGELKDASSKEMVIPVKIDIEKNEFNLIAGVTAKAQILAEEKKNAVAVALDTLMSDPETGETYVFTVSKKNVLKKQVITTGLESDFYVEVTSDNLKEGDKVVLGPSFEMTDGQTIVPADPAAAQ